MLGPGDQFCHTVKRDGPRQTELPCAAALSKPVALADEADLSKSQDGPAAVATLSVHNSCNLRAYIRAADKWTKSGLGESASEPSAGRVFSGPKEAHGKFCTAHKKGWYGRKVARSLVQHTREKVIGLCGAAASRGPGLQSSRARPLSRNIKVDDTFLPSRRARARGTAWAQFCTLL